MDSVTQALLGAAVGDTILGKNIGYKAALLGAIGGTLPDLDVLLFPFFSELDRISLHRGYSHSILFCVFGAFLFAYFLSKFKWTNNISLYKLSLFCFLVFITHVLLDAFTTFGTQLFLPFSDYRVSFDSVNIVDPVYTLPLLTGLFLHLFYYKKRDNHSGLANKIGLAISTLYLVFTLYNKEKVGAEFVSQLNEQKITSLKFLSVPVSFANVNWYGVAKDETNLYIGKYSQLEKNKIEFHSFPINDELLLGLDKHLIDRMKWFSQGFYTVAELDGKIRFYNMQCDMQGVRTYGNYKAPTAFYFELIPEMDGGYKLSSGMHDRESINY